MFAKLPLVLVVAALLAPLATGVPTGELVARQASTCAQYQEIASGPYTLQTNQWGAQTGQGSQCSTINGVNGNSIAWTTSWSWANNPNNVKSYTNVRPTNFQSKPWSQYASIPTTWSWKSVAPRVVHGPPSNRVVYNAF